MIAGLTDRDPVAVTGRGTGIDDGTWMRKVAAVRDALWRTRDDADPDTLLRRAGGADLAVMCGLLLGCARRDCRYCWTGGRDRGGAGGQNGWNREQSNGGRRATAQRNRPTASPCRTGAGPVLTLSMRLGEGVRALTALPVGAVGDRPARRNGDLRFAGGLPVRGQP